VDRGLAAVRKAENKRGEAAVMRHIGGLRIFQARYSDAIGWLTEARSAFHDIGDMHGEAFAIFSQGIAIRKVGRYTAVLGQFESALTLLRANGDRLGVAHALRHVGQIHMAMTNFAQAVLKLSEALDIVHAEGCLPVEGHVRQCLGELMMSRGRYSERPNPSHVPLRSPNP
jgi:tetratricopeptide (TPR) repeat protein